MLVLSRRLNEKILFPSLAASVQVIGIRAGVVRLGIDAPPHVPVLREEVRDRGSSATGAADGPDKLRQLINLVDKRLDVTTRGLDELRHHLHGGSVADAEAVLSEVRDDLESLRRRIDGVIGKQPVPSVRPCKALLVEDDRNERELLAGFLRLAGVDVATAGDGDDALAYLKAQSRPDVVLLDMGLPRCDGATAVRAIRKNPALAGLKIFAVSGHSPDEYGLTAGPAGIDRWFHKPVDPVQLLQDMNSEVCVGAGSL